MLIRCRVSQPFRNRACVSLALLTTRFTFSSDVDIRPPTYETFKTGMDKRWDFWFVMISNHLSNIIGIILLKRSSLMGAISLHLNKNGKLISRRWCWYVSKCLQTLANYRNWTCHWFHVNHMRFPRTRHLRPVRADLYAGAPSYVWAAVWRWISRWLRWISRWIYGLQRSNDQGRYLSKSAEQSSEPGCGLKTVTLTLLY